LCVNSPATELSARVQPKGRVKVRVRLRVRVSVSINKNNSGVVNNGQVPKYDNIPIYTLQNLVFQTA